MSPSRGSANKFENVFRASDNSPIASLGQNDHGGGGCLVLGEGASELVAVVPDVVPFGVGGDAMVGAGEVAA